MKRYLICVLLGLMAFWGCIELEDTFYVSNISGFFGVSGEYLVNDYGTAFPVTSDGTDGKWKDCGRIWGRYDITDSRYSTFLREYFECETSSPVAGIPEEGEDGDFKDRVSILDHSISTSGYFNLKVRSYYLPESNYTHRNILLYSDDPENRILTLALFHDGNGEDSTNYKVADLKSKDNYYSFKISDLAPAGSSRDLRFIYYITGSDGSTVRANTWLSTSSIQF